MPLQHVIWIAISMYLGLSMIASWNRLLMASECAPLKLAYIHIFNVEDGPQGKFREWAQMPTVTESSYT